MKNSLYTIAILLLIFWAAGVLFFGSSGVIHILLVFGLIVIMIRLIQQKKAV
ncbi:MAG: lmo0937 family membrane protein [Chloroflexia bacterium]|nr:lmo0937 family membrane protein [Chloroflexia bacterium]